MDMRSDPNGILEQAWEGAKWLLTILLGWLGVSVKRQINRIDRIEAHYVSTDVLNKTIDALRNDFKNHAEGMHEDMREIRNHLYAKPSNRNGDN